MDERAPWAPRRSETAERRRLSELLYDLEMECREVGWGGLSNAVKRLESPPLTKHAVQVLPGAVARRTGIIVGTGSLSRKSRTIRLTNEGFSMKWPCDVPGTTASSQ